MSAASLRRRGLMLVLSSPSGAGKTTISRRLLEADKDIVLSVSVTTRTPRPNEVDGRDYRFIDKRTFDAMVAEDALLEHAEVFGHHYGTPRGPVEQALAGGRDVLFDVDWQGARQLGQRMRKDLATIFILPPSTAELERRLRTRRQDADHTVSARMAKASGEIAHWDEYDYVVVNHDVDEALAQVRAILAAERLRRARQEGLVGFVAGLIGQV